MDGAQACYPYLTVDVKVMHQRVGRRLIKLCHVDREEDLIETCSFRQEGPNLDSGMKQEG